MKEAVQICSSEGEMGFLSGYKNFSVARAGVMNCAWPKIGALFEVDHDLRPLFPYLNAILTDAKYFESPKHIQFFFEGVQCTLYPFEIVAAAFNDADGARLFSKRLLAYLNEIFQCRDTIKPCHKTIVPISPIDIYRLLPKTNCGKCGLVSCFAFAAALSKGKKSTGDCPGFSEPITEKAVYPVFDKEGNLSSTVELNIPSQRNLLSVPNNLLTDRELQVLKLLANGASNLEISKALFISHHTVKTHVTHIYDKLGVNDRAKAAVWAARHNVI